MRGRAKPRRDDLFAIFPDLPRPRSRTRDEQILRMRRLLMLTRSRAARRIVEQQFAVARVRARVAERQRQLRLRRG